MPGFEDLFVQALKAAAYYAASIVLVRVAGKRFAGQTTTFDLWVLITLGVVLQSAALAEGMANALAFVLTVFVLHLLNGWGCARASTRSVSPCSRRRATSAPLGAIRAEG